MLPRWWPCGKCSAGVASSSGSRAGACHRPTTRPPRYPAGEPAMRPVFLVFSANVAVVAVKFHGAPPAVGMLAPAPLLIPLIYWVVFRREPLILTATLPAIVLFLLVQLVSALGSQDPHLAVKVAKTSLLEGLAIYLV